MWTRVRAQLAQEWCLSAPAVRALSHYQFARQMEGLHFHIPHRLQQPQLPHQVHKLPRLHRSLVDGRPGRGVVCKVVDLRPPQLCQPLGHGFDYRCQLVPVA